MIFKKNTKNLKILTPNGYQHFDGIAYMGEKFIYRLELENNFWIECTDDHPIYVNNTTKIPAGLIKVNEEVCVKNGKLKVINAYHTGRIEKVYDVIGVENGNRYYGNELLISNCQFIIDEETLISSLKLASLEAKDPIYKSGQVRWFKRPSKGHIYTVALDPSLGTGGDASAIQVFEADTTTQVAEWKHNRTPIPEQIKILADICKSIIEDTSEPENLYYSLENNNIGEAALISLVEYGEENIHGTMLSEPKVAGSARRYRKGFNTTNKSKLAACSKFKNLLESNKLTVHSSTLISELKTFVASGGSYAAKIGETDDLVMSCLLAVRMFQHLQNYNVDLDNHIRDHSEILEPLPFIAVF